MSRRLFFNGFLPGLFLLSCSFGIEPQAADRATLDLTGAWQYQKVSELNYPPPANWLSTTVPGYLSGGPYEKAWFRRSVTLPGSLDRQRVKLRFGGVKYNSTVRVNGQVVGGCTNGYNPFVLDITATALPGQVNEILVGLTDWTGLFSTPVDFSNLAPGEGYRDRAKDVVVAPIGGHFDLYGLWEPVSIELVPEVSVADVFVQPSHRHQRIEVRVRLRNESGGAATVALRNRVLDTTAGGLVLPPLEVLLAAGSTTEVEVSAPWPDPRRWNLDDPHLNHLETSLEIAGAATDAVTNRFGFREFWVSGESFHLNGTPLHLRATSCWPPVQFMDRAAIRAVLEEVKAGNNNAFRLHTQPWPKLWYEVADEVGLLIVEEAAVWCDPRAYRLSDPVFWAHYAEHLTAAVERDRNHPSIVLWSLENEILHCGGDGLYAGTANELAELGRLVKSLDPTRPITYEADLDPGGVADVLGLHYPHEYPDHVLWPDTAYWMDQPITKRYAPGGTWKWDRTKPLYIGEYLWVPETAAQTLTILHGDVAYADPRGYRNLAKALTWRMQTEAYRDYGVSAFCPWTMFEDPAAGPGPLGLNPAENLLYQTQAAAYEANAVFVREYDSRFFAGETVSRTLKIYNDTPAPGTFTLRWGTGADLSTRLLTLEPAGRTTEVVTFSVPTQSGTFAFRVELLRDGMPVYSNTLPYVAVAKSALRLQPGIRLGLFDPVGATAALFRREGVTFQTVTNLLTDPCETFSVLVVGRNGLVADPLPEVGLDSVADRWQRFAQRGGWVLVLEQTDYPRWMPLGLALIDEPTHFAFPVADHPVVAGLTPEDLRWWRENHRVADRTIRIPSRGNFRVLAHVGANDGLERAVLLESRWGRGGLLCSQGRLIEAYDTEPMAGRLLQRLLDSCTPAAERSRPAALLTEANSAAAATLGHIGLLAERIAGHVAETDLTRYHAVLVAGDTNTWNEAQSNLQRLTQYARAGGILWLHRPPETFLNAVASSLLQDLTWETSLPLPVLRSDAAQPPGWFTSHDLYWADDPGSWSRAAVLSSNIACRAYRAQFTLTNHTTLPVENMPVKSTGQSVSGGWALYQNGYVAQTISVSEAGRYLFGVQARGTPALGVYPRLVLRIDGVFADVVGVSSASYRLFTLGATLSAGSHELTLEFDNDAWNPPNEDRNLYLDFVRYGRATAADGAEWLTRPGVLARIESGEGTILLDEIQWENPGKHLTKAERLLSSLLTSFDIAMLPSRGLRLEAESMTPMGFGAGSSATNQGLFWYYAAGRLESRVRFNATGRYSFDVTALGTPAAGGWPRIELRINGSLRGTIEVNNANLSTYRLQLNVNAGTHTVAFAYVNDFYQPPEDRNVALDSIWIQPEPRPEILDATFQPEPAQLSLSWTSAAGQTNDLEFSPDLSASGWTTLTSVVSAGLIARWVDEGSASGTPPASAERPRGFYRLRTR